MALVGDLIVRSRERFPDPTISVLPPPTVGTPTPSGAGGSLVSGTYYFMLTNLNQWGESLNATEVAVIVTGPTGQITFAPTLAVGATGYRIYNGGLIAGSEASYLSVTGSGSTIITTLAQFISPGAPPIRATAWIPDTDGSFVSAFTMFGWMNDGLRMAGRIGGGLLDLGAIQAIANAPMYRITGRWIRFTQAWFDGWPLSFARKGDIFLHNPTSGVSGMMSTESFAETTVVQIFPQPNRSGATTTLTVQLLSTDSTATVANNASFLPMGLFQVDSEIISYGAVTSTTSMPYLVRGFGGTMAATHANGAAVTELNIRFSGFRQPIEYAPGQSSLTINLPPAWEVPIQDYIVAQYKKAEKNAQEGAALEKSAIDAIKELATMARLQTQPTQMGSATREVYPGGYGGGILIP